MQVSNVDLEHINEQSNRPKVSQIDGFAAQTQNGVKKDKDGNIKDTIVLDQERVNLRALCDEGKAIDRVIDIINSGIEPDFLRAELAFRFKLNDTIGMTIVLNYLAGNFKTALEQTQLLNTAEEQAEYEEFMLYAAYFGGNYEKAASTIERMQQLNFSPFLCYAYADMLLSYGYLDKARRFNFRYEVLAKEYLPNFVSEKKKYDEEKKRRNQLLQRSKQKPKDKKQKGSNQQQKDELSDDEQTALMATLKLLLERRKKLIEVLSKRNISINKRPLLFELEDIDYQIAKKTDKVNQE